MIKRFFCWWKRNHHTCKGTVQYEYTVSTRCFSLDNPERKGSLGTGICSICTCDTCGKSFATVETAALSKNVSVKVAVAEALTNGMLNQRYKDLLNNLARNA